MSTTEHSTAGSIRLRGPAISASRRVGATTIAAVAALAASILLALASAAPASAAGLAITSHADGAFVAGTTVPLAGVGTDGAQITVTGPGVVPCTTVVAGGSWACTLELPQGATTLTATQTTPESSRPTPPAPDGGTAPDALAAPATETVTITLRVLGTPAITGADPLATSGLVTGTAYPNAGIRLRSGDRTLECPATGADGVWTCPVTGVPDGSYAVSVQQYAPGAPGEASPWSAPRTIVLDTVVPAAPSITTPTAGAQLAPGVIAFSGTGETGASLDVFATGTLLCRVAVVDGAWACSVAGPVGEQVVQAVQRDAAGNYSAPSPVVRMTFGVVPPAGQQAVPVEPPPAVPVQPAPSPDDSAPAPVDPSSPVAPGTSGGTRPDVDAGWAAPTGFGAALPALASAVVIDQGLIGLLVAAAFILLVALPLRVALPVVAARLHWRAPRVFGRNRGRELARGLPDADDHVAPAWPRLLAVGVAATALIALSIGIEGEARYARMLLAIAVGVLLVNAVGIGLATLVAGRVARTPVRWRIVGPFLIAAAVATLVSRLLALEPPLVIGVVLTGMAMASLGSRRAATVALAQLGATAVLATAAWLAHPAAIGLGGFWGAALGETIAAVCIAGFGSVALLLLPIGALPGRAVFEWSMPVWAGCTVVAVGLAGAALAASGGSLAALALIGLGVAALCMGAWAWVRWVEPALAARG